MSSDGLLDTVPCLQINDAVSIIPTQTIYLATCNPRVVMRRDAESGHFHVAYAMSGDDVPLRLCVLGSDGATRLVLGTSLGLFSPNDRALFHGITLLIEETMIDVITPPLH